MPENKYIYLSRYAFSLMSFEVKTWWLKVIEMIRFVTVIVKKGFGKYVEKSSKMIVSKYVEKTSKKEIL